MSKAEEALCIARGALEALSYIHDGNPSDAMADVDPVEYARHTLWCARTQARQALRDVDEATHSL